LPSVETRQGNKSVFADATQINTIELIQPHFSANGLITAIAKSS
jgi:hypothetical protein